MLGTRGKGFLKDTQSISRNWLVVEFATIYPILDLMNSEVNSEINGFHSMPKSTSVLLTNQSCYSVIYSLLKMEK